MPYTPFVWSDNPAGATPITATRLNAIEQGIASASNVTSTSAAGKYIGQRSDDQTTGISWRWNGSAWKPWECAWITYATSVNGFSAGSGGSTLLLYKWAEGDVLWRFDCSIGTGATALTGIFGFPFPPLSGQTIADSNYKFFGFGVYQNTGSYCAQLAVQLVSGPTIALGPMFTQTIGSYNYIRDYASQPWPKQNPSNGDTISGEMRIRIV